MQLLSTRALKALRSNERVGRQAVKEGGFPPDLLQFIQQSSSGGRFGGRAFAYWTPIWGGEWGVSQEKCAWFNREWA